METRAVGGLLVGAWWVKNENKEAQKSRAERDDAEGVEEICQAASCHTEFDHVAQIGCGEFEGLLDIIVPQLWIFAEEVFPVWIERNRFYYPADGQAHSSYARLTVHLSWVHGYLGRISRLSWRDLLVEFSFDFTPANFKL
jgi:hypothetical protein